MVIYCTPLTSVVFPCSFSNFLNGQNSVPLCTVCVYQGMGKQGKGNAPHKIVMQKDTLGGAGEGRGEARGDGVRVHNHSEGNQATKPATQSCLQRPSVTTSTECKRQSE